MCEGTPDSSLFTPHVFSMEAADIGIVLAALAVPYVLDGVASFYRSLHY